MAKRFTDTDKFIDPWYRRLASKHKVLWDWLLCNCDHAGIITVDFEFIEMVLNETYSDDVFDAHFMERIIKIGPSKYFIPKFIKFQYGKLNPESRVHKSVMSRLSENGIHPATLLQNDAPSIGYTYPLDTPKDKDKDKNIDSSFLNKFLKKEELFNTNPPEKNLPADLPQDFRNSKDSKISPDELIQLFNDTLAGKGRLGHCRGLSGKQLHDLTATLGYPEFQKRETWQELFGKVAASDFLLGQRGTFAATLNWLIDHGNALKVLNGQYNGTPEAQKPPKKSFSGRGHGVALTEQNPTGNPYLQEAIDKGLVS